MLYAWTQLCLMPQYKNMIFLSSMWWNRLKHRCRQKWTSALFVSSCPMCDVEMSGSTSGLSLLRAHIESLVLLQHHAVSSDLPMRHVPLWQSSLLLLFVPMTLYSTVREGTSSSIVYRLWQLWWPHMLITLRLCVCIIFFFFFFLK